MKKIMTLMLGLGLVAGTATFAFSQTSTDTNTKKKAKSPRRAARTPPRAPTSRRSSSALNPIGFMPRWHPDVGAARHYFSPFQSQ